MNRFEYETQFKLTLAMLMLEIAGYPAKSEQFNELYKHAVAQMNENLKRDYAAFIAADLARLRKANENYQKMTAIATASLQEPPVPDPPASSQESSPPSQEQ